MALLGGTTPWASNVDCRRTYGAARERWRLSVPDVGRGGHVGAEPITGGQARTPDVTGPIVRRHLVGVGEYQVAALRAGPATTTPVVCVHGAGISSRPLRPLVERLGETAETWAVDLPGFGRSSKPREPLDLIALGDALADWMGAMDLPPACLVGSSFGCQIVTDVAVRHPAQVQSLVLAGPTIDPAARTWPRTVARWLRNSVRESARMFPLNIADYRDCGTRGVIFAFRESLRDRIEDRLTAVSVPTLVVRGERDALVPSPWAEEVTRLVPNARLVTVSKSPHMIPFRAPGALAELITEFLREEADAAGQADR
jgi:pimeloyl-ACP methyl ester carboxylesterase